MKIINSRWLPAILIFFSGCGNIKNTAIVSGAVSKHIGSIQKRDETNPLLALEFNNKYQIGVYDNSRLKASNSYYITKRYLNLDIPNTPISVTSKIGAVFYDNQSNYPAELKPVLSVGLRYFLAKKIFIDFDYMPQKLIKDTDILVMSIGYLRN